MGSSFSVKHGGIIRWSLQLSANETINWLKGRVCMMDTSGQLRVNDGSANVLVGIAMESRVINQVGVTTTVVKTGASSKRWAAFESVFNKVIEG